MSFAQPTAAWEALISNSEKGEASIRGSFRSARSSPKLSPKSK